MSVANIVTAIKLFEEKYGFDFGKSWFSMEHDVLYVPGPDVDEVSEEDKEYLDLLGVIPDTENGDGWISFG